MKVTTYLNLHKKRSSLKLAFANTLSKELSQIYSQFDSQIESAFNIGVEHDSLTGSSFKTVINNFSNKFNISVDSTALKAGNTLNSIYNNMYELLDLEGGFEPITLPTVHINSFQIRREIQLLINQFRSGRITESIAKRSIKGRIKAPAHVANTLLNTNLAGIDSSATMNVATIANLDEFLYAGPNSDKSREFCQEHVGGVYSIEELELMDNGQGLPVVRYCGGYNCMHELIPVDSKWKELKKMSVT